MARLSGPDGLTGSHNTFVRRHALAEIAGEFTDGVRLEDLERATDQYLGHPSVRSLPPTEAGERRFTTEELLSCERAILDSAARRRGRGTAVAPVAIVDASVARSQPALNDDQATAVRAIASSGNGVDTVEALAGTGKTTMLRTLADAYRHAGYHVLGAAPTARAARELREVADVSAGTLHALAHQLDRGNRFRANTVLLLDEAGMASTRITAEIFGHAVRAGAKVIAVGDPGQLTSVQAGGWLAALTRQHPGPQLREVIRQHDPAEREALEALHEGDPDTYLAKKTEDITIHATELDALEAAIDQWAQQCAEHGPSGVVLIARDNATRDQLNHVARERLKADGDLPHNGVLIGQREWVTGDRIITKRNSHQLDVDNGTLATIAGFDHHRRVVHVTTDAGQQRAIDASYFANHVEHAFAITGHASQGATVEHAIAIGRPEEFTREWAYTALSRARQTTNMHLIADHGPAEKDRREYAPSQPDREPAEILHVLARTMRRSEAEPLAVEHSTTPPALSTSTPGHRVSPGQTQKPGWAGRVRSRVWRAPDPVRCPDLGR